MSQIYKSCPLGTLGDKQGLGINEVELLLPSWCSWCEGLYFNPNPIHCFLTIPESFNCNNVIISWLRNVLSMPALQPLYLDFLGHHHQLAPTPDGLLYDNGHSCDSTSKSIPRYNIFFIIIKPVLLSLQLPYVYPPLALQFKVSFYSLLSPKPYSQQHVSLWCCRLYK